MIATQCRAARALLGWSLDKLQEKTASHGDSVGRMTIVRFERGDNVNPDRVQAIRHTLEAAGVVFVGDNEVSRTGGVGVRFEKQEKE